MMSNPILTPKTFLAYSLGCRVNQAEIEKISQQLIDYGLQLLSQQLTVNSEQSPDLVLLNTCVVTTKAERETRKEVRKLRKLYPKSFLVVLGCGPTAKIKYPEADLIIMNQDKNKIIEIIKKTLNINVETRLIASLHKLKNPYIQSGRKFIKIQEGCDKFCSFCLTAHLRGKPISVPQEEIINEINFWVKEGIKEVILTGINIALYGRNPSFFKSTLNPSQNPPLTPPLKKGGALKLYLKISLTDLIIKILKETKVERITLSSIYPEMLNSEFIDLVIKNPRVSRVFHLSIQSGSPTVLVRMNRKTDINELTDYLLFIKKAIPEFTFRADFIAGFPDETQKEFEETLNFIKEVKISFAHVFPYSKRKGTAAYSLPDLAMAIKKERVKEIQEVVKEVRNREAKALIAKLLNCLIVRNNEGITENGWPLRLRDVPDGTSLRSGQAKMKKGQIVPVKITAFKNDQLWG